MKLTEMTHIIHSKKKSTRLLALCVACAGGALVSLRTPSPPLPLKKVSPIPIGVAIGYYPMKYNKVYDSIVTTDFSQVTFEYALKNRAIIKADGTADYSHADELVKICQAKGLPVYGHTLCWYQGDSPYLSKLKGDSTAIENFLRNYITTTVSRYKNTIEAWDVVNEAIDSLGRLRTTGPIRDDYFYWGKYLKSGYVARAFRYAHRANPRALLFYNDYNLEIYPRKLAGVLQLVKSLQREGVPIDGIGTQMHISIRTPDKGIDEAFRALASTGLQIRISELDIKVNPSNKPDFIMTPALEKAQAVKCRHVIASFFKYVPASQRYGITFWNLGTKDSWLIAGEHRKGSPTLFDSLYRPKAMYHATAGILHTEKASDL